MSMKNDNTLKSNLFFLYVLAYSDLISALKGSYFLFNPFEKISLKTLLHLNFFVEFNVLF